MFGQKENDRPFFLSEKDIAQMVGYWHADRRVMLSGELSKETLRNVALQLGKLDFEKTEPITLMIESGGGAVIPTQQLEDVISIINSPIDVLIIGNCASMAVDLVQMCRRRMILPSARILVHYIRNNQEWICDDLEQLDIDIRYFRERTSEIAERRLNLYQKRTGLSSEKIREIFRHGEVHNAFFSAKQALELNLVDEIVTDFKLFPRK